MPYGGQHPDNNGWPAPGVGPFVSFSHAGLPFPAGVAAGTELLWHAVADLVIANTPGGLFSPSGDQQITQANATRWELYGQETRKSRNSANYSIHSWGLAIDFNSGHNPNQPDSPPDTPFRLPPNMQQLLDDEFGARAFLWGGDPDWGSNKDWMHIECHMTPDEVAAWTAAHPTGVTSVGGSTLAHRGVTAAIKPVIIVPKDWLDSVNKQEVSDLIDARLAANNHALTVASAAVIDARLAVNNHALAVTAAAEVAKLPVIKQLAVATNALIVWVCGTKKNGVSQQNGIGARVLALSHKAGLK